jgi:hypothetical protein
VVVVNLVIKGAVGMGKHKIKVTQTYMFTIEASSTLSRQMLLDEAAKQWEVEASANMEDRWYEETEFDLE